MKQTNNSLIDIVQPDMLLSRIVAADCYPSAPHFAKPNVRCRRIVLDEVFVFVAKGLWKRLQAEKWGTKVCCRASGLCAFDT